MPLKPPTIEHCNLPMQVIEALLFCSVCKDPGSNQKISPPIIKQDLIENWPSHCIKRKGGGYLSLSLHLKCQNRSCKYTLSQDFPNGRISPDFIPGKLQNRVFIGGNYNKITSLRI